MATGKPTGEHIGSLPDSSGTYALLLALSQSVQLRVGALGECRFDSGWYVYLGSALGPGGLAARVGRHIGAKGRTHWHIDCLTRVGEVVRVGWLVGEQRRECSWAQAVGDWSGARLALARFGASDCRCDTHLWAFYEKPDLAGLPGAGVIALLDLAEPPS
jgi:Uri superfamily endonuclease